MSTEESRGSPWQNIPACLSTGEREAKLKDPITNHKHQRVAFADRCLPFRIEASCSDGEVEVEPAVITALLCLGFRVSLKQSHGKVYWAPAKKKHGIWTNSDDLPKSQTTHDFFSKPQFFLRSWRLDIRTTCSPQVLHSPRCLQRRRQVADEGSRVVLVAAPSDWPIDPQQAWLSTGACGVTARRFSLRAVGMFIYKCMYICKHLCFFT